MAAFPLGPKISPGFVEFGSPALMAAASPGHCRVLSIRASARYLPVFF